MVRRRGGAERWLTQAGRIEIRPAALKTLRKLGRKDRDRIKIAIGQLPDGDLKRLRGPERLMRLRVGDWRVIFDLRTKEKAIDVLAIRPRAVHIASGSGV